MKDDHKWLTRTEAGIFCGVNPRTIDRWADDPRVSLTRHRLHGLQWVRFDLAELEAIRTAAPTPEA